MSNDAELAKEKITQLCTVNPSQYGQSLVVTVNPGVATEVTIAKDVVRWKGKSETDIQPCRIYLGPWQPQPLLVGTLPIAGYSYAQPHPWQEPEPTQYDTFAQGQIQARVSFGAGGVQHQAYVDWPPRGLLFQVGAQYVQVDGVGQFTVPAASDIKLPRLLAHIAPEPGGGDSVQPATFTYPPIDFNNNPGAAPGVLCQVPPFARAFRPIINQLYAFNTGPFFYRIVDLGGGNTWYLNSATANDFNRDDFPLTGLSRDIFIQAENALGGAAVGTINVGCMFLLDL